LVDDGVSSQSEVSNLHDRSQKVYEHVEQPEMELAYIELAKEWNSSVEWNPIDSEGEQDEFISGDEEGTLSEVQEIKFLTI